MPAFRPGWPLVPFAVAALALSGPANGDSYPAVPPVAPPSYADLADLTDQTPLVIRAQVRSAVAVDPARTRGVRPGWARAYVEARTETLIGGSHAIGEQLRYLVDLPVDARGRLPALKKKSVIVFARPVAGRPGELQLVAPDAQLPWDAGLETRLRSLLAEFYAPGAPQKVSGVREALHVPGSLAGQGETQLFLATANGEPAAITVIRQPGADMRFAVSFSEVVGEAAGLPPSGSLMWYRLACFLPPRLPAGANIADQGDDRSAAEQDYQAVIAHLGPCARTRK